MSAWSMTGRTVSPERSAASISSTPWEARAGDGSAAAEPVEPAAALALGLGVAGAPLVGGDHGLDLADVLAAAGPRGLGTGLAGDRSAHDGSPCVRVG